MVRGPQFEKRCAISFSFEGGGSRSHYVEASFWRRLWTCHQTEYWMDESFFYEYCRRWYSQLIAPRCWRLACSYLEDTVRHPRRFVFGKFVRKLNCSWSEAFVNRGLIVQQITKTLNIRGQSYQVRTNNNWNTFFRVSQRNFTSCMGLSKHLFWLSASTFHSIWHKIHIYLKQLGFHPVAAVSRLVQQYERDSTTEETAQKSRKTIQNHNKHKTETNIQSKLN